LKRAKEHEKLELIYDTRKSINRAFEIIHETKKELLILFATRRTSALALAMYAIDVYRKIAETGVRIRILIPRGSEVDDIIEKVKEQTPSLEIRLSDADLNTKLTILISDRKEFMSWELKDDTLDDPYKAGGIAAYSNIESLASSYATIFGNLWMITELAEKPQAANVKLENDEKAMKEFII